MATLYHQVQINAPVSRVYEAIAIPDKIGTWWDKQAVTETDRGSVLEHNPGPEHGAVKLRVVELIPNTRVEWECISTHPRSSPASAWTGTHFIFELRESESGAASAQGSATTLDFHQVGYDEQSRFYGSNNFAWGQVLQNLKRVVESQNLT